MKRRVLIIAYQFPPVGGAGVQRVAKLTKYLPAHGWDVSILTAANHSVPTRDPSLLSDIPPQTIIRTARSFEPSYRLKNAITSTNSASEPWSAWKFLKQWGADVTRRVAVNVLQPDPQILWVQNAIREGKRLLQELDHHAILVSGPPFSAFFVGTALKKATRLPLVLDYRDEWTIADRYGENKGNNPWTRFCQQSMQRMVLSKADSIVATTQLSAQTLENQSAKIGNSVKAHCIYNGFDQEDMIESPQVRSKSNRLRLTYIGTLWRLTTSRPLFEAISKLAKSSPELIEKLDIEFVGRITPEEQTWVTNLKSLPCRVICRDYVDHSEAVRLMRNADQLCLFLDCVAGAERVIPAKIFEYLAANRRILVISPEGELTRLASGFDGVDCFQPQDIDPLAKHLRKLLTNIPLASEKEWKRELSEFRRDNLAGEMAKVLYETCFNADLNNNKLVHIDQEIRFI